MAGVSYATRRPQRSRVSAAGAAKLALIKSKVRKADGHAHRAQEIQESDPEYKVLPYLAAIRNILEEITDLCEESNET